jgi:murein L,D-transpeptidase YafK
MRLMPEPERDAMFAIYAFCRKVDDIADDGTGTRPERHEKLESWRADWESRNHERYMQHYSRNFSSGGVNHASWDRQKQQVNAGKEWLKIGISNLSIVRNPGQEEFMVVNFEQDYRSSNLHNQMRKRQYWVKESGRWRIIYEGNG